jgi:DNA replication protein DnaC
MEPPSFNDLLKKAQEDIKNGIVPQPLPEESIETDLNDVPLMYREAKLPEKYNQSDSVYLWSAEPGTGKTYIAWAYYINERLKNPKQRPIFSTFGGLQLRLRATMNGSTEIEDNIIKEFSIRKLVILDDLSGLRQGGASDYSLSMIFEILNNRYSWKRQTIITSNKSIGDISASFDARIASRLVGMCKVIELTGNDRRLNNGTK